MVKKVALFYYIFAAFIVFVDFHILHSFSSWSVTLQQYLDRVLRVVDFY